MGAIGGRIALFLMALGLAASASAEQTIRYAEPVDIPVQGATTSFDAYGRRFALKLTDNERVLQKLPVHRKQQLARYRLLRGSLEGAPGSWVRLTESSRGVEGAIWDGRELYAVARYDSVAPYLTTPLDAAPDQTVVYRLSDARDALPRDFCDLAGGTAEAQVTALDQYQALVSEIQGGIETPVVSKQLEIALIADSDFQRAEQDPVAAMMARLNIVEGIFSEQIGLLILATEIRLMAADTDPFTSTQGTTLLEQLGAYRDANTAIRARGLAHLMTGKDLDGTTAGIAYVGTVCEVQRGVSASQRTYGTTISALIMAHELGHNLGAEHDGVDGTACARVGNGFIMAPSVSGYTTFSHCSIESMQAVLSAASCVKPAEYADVALMPDVYAVAGEGGRPFTLPFTVSSIGNRTAGNVEVTVTLPANAAALVESASTSLGSCDVSGLTARCQLGEMAEGASAQVNVIALGNTAGSFNVQAAVQAEDDRLSFNNRAVLPVSLRSGVDASVSLTASAPEVRVGETLEFQVDVSSRRALAVRNATLSVNLNQPIASASMPGGQCTVNASSLSCYIEEIPAGTFRRLTVLATASNAGPLSASASINAPGDGDFHNNASAVSGWVQAERDVELTTVAAVGQLAVGTEYEIPFTLRSRGSAPTGNVALLVSLPAATLIVESIDAAGGSCAVAGENLLRCEIGVLAPGTSREVRLRVRGTGQMAADVVASAITDGDGYISNNNVSVRLSIDHDVDLAVVLASGGAGLEGTSFEGQVTLRSQGREAAVGATLDIDLHAAGMLRSAGIHQGADCELLSVTRARCALPSLTRMEQLYVAYEAIFAEPGEYDVTFTIRTPDDTGPDNDQLVRAILVRPYLDVAVSGSFGGEDLVGGQTRETAFAITAGRRDLATARFVASHAARALVVESISAETGDCRVDPLIGGICDFTGMAASSDTEVKVVYRAADEAAVAHPMVAVSTPGDVASGNDSLKSRISILAATDVALRVDSTLTGARGTVLTFPLIELVNGANPALSPWVEVHLAAGITLVDVSAGNAVCTGTTTLRCEFASLDAAATASVSLTIRAASAGRFVSEVRAGAGNDTNPANDSRDVAIDISGDPPQPAPGGGGSSGSAKSGGGGQMDWLALLVLALLKISFVHLARRRSLVSRPPVE